jgi:hypothetical protein
VNATREFLGYVEILRRRRRDGGPEPSAAQEREARELWLEAERVQKALLDSDASGVMYYAGVPLLPSWESIKLELWPEDAAPGPETEAAASTSEAAAHAGVEQHPAHRLPDPLPRDKIEKLDELLEKRALAGNPRKGPLTQTRIAEKAKLKPSRVQQGQALREAGWPLLRSTPDFSTLQDPDGVYWPQLERALEILASES